MAYRSLKELKRQQKSRKDLGDAKKWYKTDAAREKVLKQCQNDLYFLATEILGYDLCEPVPHQELCDFIESTHKKKLLVGSRGIFKTTLGTVSRAIQICLQDSNNRILIVSNTLPNARRIVAQVKDHFESNPKLTQLIPELLPKARHKIPWSSTALLLNRDKIYSEATITAAGVETQLASQHYSHIIGDDVVAARRDDLKEGGLMVLRPEEVDKAVGWYKLTMQGLQQLTNDPDKQTETLFIVNRWGVFDFAKHILDNHAIGPRRRTGFATKVMGVHRDDGSLLWSNVLNEHVLSEARLDMGDFMYFTQMECKPYNPQDRGFPVEDNTYYEGVLPPNWQDMKVYALMDLADSTKPDACNTAIVVVFVDGHNHIWVNEAMRGKMDTPKKMQNINGLVVKYSLKSFYIEENLHKDTLEYTLRNEMKRSGIQYVQRPLKHKNRNKAARIMRLQPHHRYGGLHIRKNLKYLLEEMRDFPHTHKKDILDALGYMMDIVKGPMILAEQEIEEAPVIQTIISVREMMASIDAQNRQYGAGLFSKQKSPKHDYMKLDQYIA